MYVIADARRGVTGCSGRDGAHCSWRPFGFLFVGLGRHAKTPGKITDGTCLATIGGSGLKNKAAAQRGVRVDSRIGL